MGGNAAIDALARDQLGLVTRAQAREAGLSSSAIDRRLKSGELEIAAPHVYRLRSGPPPSIHQRLRAICLSLGFGSVASHRTAAWIWGLDRFDREPEALDITAPLGRRLALDKVEVHQRRAAAEEGFVFRSGVPVTALPRTLLDLATCLKPAELEVALDSAARFRPDFFVELDELIGRVKSRGRPGIRTLYGLVRLRREGKPTGSPLETEVFQALRRAGIELPVLQYDIRGVDGAFICRPDFVWPRKQIALFVDSGYHVGKRARIDGMQRLALTRLGWKPVVVVRDLLKNGTWISEFATLFWPVVP